MFPDELKEADITPVFKKGSKSEKENYRPVSILSNISKIYERCMYDQLSEYFEGILSKYQCGFRKGHGAQHCLVVLIEKWKKYLDKGNHFGVLLTDLSKAFDVIPHDLLIAKLYAYELDSRTLKLLNNYLSNRKQRVRIGKCFSTWVEILTGVPQGSILGPLLFNIFICDLFYAMTDFEIASYADDNSTFSGNVSKDMVLSDLREAGNIIFDWCNCNGMKANPEKSHLLINQGSNETLYLQNLQIKASYSEKLLGITIDNNLNFDEHITKICKKASQKLSAIARISPYMSLTQRKLIVNAFFFSQFGYCPLVWMCHNRSLNNKINNIHERCLRLIYFDYESTFSELLSRDNSVSIHHRNLRTLATEIYKFINSLSPEIMNDFLKKEDFKRYDLRSAKVLKTINPKSVHYGTESLSFLAPKLWKIVPVNIKQSNSLQVFKSKIKNWIPSECSCRLCKAYIAGVGFID